jgi:hypothetical protein
MSMPRIDDDITGVYDDPNIFRGALKPDMFLHRGG